MIDAIYREMRNGFYWQLIFRSYIVFGKAHLLGQGFALQSFLLAIYHPVHRSQIQPVIGPIEFFLRVCINKLRKEGPVESGILTDENRHASFNFQISED